MRGSTLGVLHFAALVLVATPIAAHSQQCAVDRQAAWYRGQVAWLNDAKRDWSSDSLRQALVLAVGADTLALHSPQLGATLLFPARAISDTSALLWLRERARHRELPWPTRSVVGAAGVRAALRLAESDTSLERTALHRMMEAGPGEALPADVAVLEDRLRVRAGRGQLYGTQLTEITRDGVTKLVPSRIEDSAHVDMRRSSAGLPPLASASVSPTRRESSRLTTGLASPGFREWRARFRRALRP